MPKRTGENPHEAKVKEIRDNFKDDFDHWDPIYRDGDLNMKFLTDGPWKDTDKQAREDAGRPVCTFDELGQYLNSSQNEVRLNPRSPKFSPEGDGASDQTATIYGNAYRKAEYRSNGQECYTIAFDNALSRGFSFVRLKLDYEHAKSFYQQVGFEPVPNPNSCYPDCNSIRADGSDWMRFTFIESYSRAEFERTFPNAEFTDFSSEQMAAVGSRWMGNDRIQVAEYWEVEIEKRALIEYEAPATKSKPQRYVTWLEGEGKPKPRGGRVIQERTTDVRHVYQYLTNGVELLIEEGEEERQEYPGTMIPFAPCYGKMVWVNEGTGPQRKILSMVTLMREPYAAYCFAAACELEAIGTITKNPYWAYEGQLDANLKNRVKTSLHEPVAILEAKASLPGMPAGTILPLPQRNPMAVDLTAYAMVKEGARQAIRAAAGFGYLPTPAQRQNEKSGVALKKIDETAQRGSYHFTDHYNDMLRRLGVIFEDVFDKITDVEREIITIEADKAVTRVHVAGWNGQGKAPERPKDLAKDVQFVPSLAGRHAVTVDVGPEFQSERDEAGAFLDNFIVSPLFASLEPPKRDRLMAMSIKERLSGPTGQKMAEIIDPKPTGELPDAKELQAALAQAKDQIIPGLQKQIAQLLDEKAAKVTELQGRQAIAAQTDQTRKDIAAMNAAQKREDTAADNQNAIQIQHMKDMIAKMQIDVDRLRAGLDVQKHGATLEHATAMAERGRAHAAEESEAGRLHATEEAEAGRESASVENQADRDAAAEAAEQAAAASGEETEP